MGNGKVICKSMSTHRDRPIFEIQDSDINVTEIMAEIESSLRRKNIDQEEISRISRLKLSTEIPQNYREFDPAETAHFFEKGISPPRFTNPIFKYIRGPLRWLLVKFIEGYSLFDKKVSENRIKAFFSVVYELLLLRKKHETLEKKFHEMYRDMNEIKSHLFSDSKPQFFYSPNAPLERSQEESNLKLVEMLKNNGKSLILFPEYDNFLQLLQLNQIPHVALLHTKNDYTYFRENISNSIEYFENIENYNNFSEYKNIVFFSNACKLPGWMLEKLLFSIRKYSDTDSKIFLRYSNSSITYHSPFQPNFPTRISPELLFHFLKETGFKNIIRHTVDDGELSLITFQKS